MDELKPENDLASLAWNMFTTNGQPGYYMLYHEMIKDELEKDPIQ